MSEHTAAPWRQEFMGVSDRVGIYDIVTDTKLIAENVNEDDAEFIVTACNAHDTLTQQRDELVQALANLLGSFETTLEMAYTKDGAKLIGSAKTYARMATARAALAKVKP